MPTRMRLLDLIALAKKLAPLIPLLKMPEWADAEDTRVWAVKLLGVLDGYAKATSTHIDDQLVAFFQTVTENDATWGTIHGLIMDLVGDDAGCADDDSRIPLLAGEVGLDPISIIAIINAIVSLVKWWRSRK